MKTYLSIQASISEEIVGSSTAGGRVDHCLRRRHGVGDGLGIVIVDEEARREREWRERGRQVCEGRK